MAWLTDYSYRKEHEIEQSAGAGSGYQVCIKVYAGEGTDGTEDLGHVTAGKVYLNNNAQSDFDDVRFTEDDGETELSHWRQEKVDDDYAIFWVKVSGDLGSGNVTIYVYYGNESASDASDGESTFEFFDDFDDDLSKWNQRSGTWTLTDDSGTSVLKSATGNWEEIATDSFTIEDLRILARIRKTNAYMGHGIIGRSSAAQVYYIACIKGYFYHIIELWRRNGGSWLLIDSDNTYYPDTAYHLECFTIVGSALEHFIDGVSKTSGTNSDLTGSQPIGFVRRYTSTNRWFYTDYCAVTKLIASEPAHGDWGEEEEPSAGGGDSRMYYYSVNGEAKQIKRGRDRELLQKTKSLLETIMGG